MTEEKQVEIKMQETDFTIDELKMINNAVLNFETKLINPEYKLIISIISKIHKKFEQYKPNSQDKK